MQDTSTTPSHSFLDFPLSLSLLNTLRSFSPSNNSFSTKFLAQLHHNLHHSIDATQNPHDFSTFHLEKLILSIHYFLSLILNIDQLLAHFTHEPIIHDLNIKAISSTNIFNLSSLINCIKDDRPAQSPDRQYGPRSPLWKDAALANNKISFIDSFRIRVINERTHISNGALHLSLPQLESVITSQGHLDLQFTINLCSELNKAFNLTLHHYLLPSNASNIPAKRISQSYTYTPEAFNAHMLTFTQEEDPKALYNTLLSLQKIIIDSLQYQDTASLELLKRLFISLLGHQSPKVREKAVIYLNIIIDGADWQLEAPFKPQISTVDHEFTVSYLLDSKHSNQSMILMLNSLPFDKSDLSSVISYHPVEITRLPENPELCVATSPIGVFPRPGFYDYRIITVDSHGNFTTLHAKAQISQNKELIKEDNKRNTSVLAQGRYIVHTKNARKLEIHEIFADNPRGIPGQMYKGSFSKIQEMIPQYNQAGINCLYILGALERDHGAYIDQKTKQKMFKRQDVSPLAVTCRKSVSSYLGGDEEFKRMMEVAKGKEMKIMVDCVMRISSSRANNRYKDLMLKCVDEDGKFEYAYGAETRGRKHEDTIYLNLRRKEVWDLLVQETMSFVDKYHIDGLNLDDAQGWPQLFEADLEEMSRNDTDDEQIYNLENRFYGDFIQKGKLTGYWTTEARHQYSNPLLVDFCRQLWQRFPELILIGENCTTIEHTRTEVSLINSGIIPRMYSFPYAAATLYGKRLSNEGIFHDNEALGVNSFRIWYENFARSLPEGSIVIQSTTHHSWPNPALLMKRGAWSFIDLLFMFPHVPMTFMGECEGYGFRCKTLDMVTFGEKSAHKPCDFTKMEILNSSGVKNTLEDYRKAQEGLTREISEGHGGMFNLKRIADHYKHRRQLRNNIDVLREGELVNLSTGHLEGPLSRVLTYARVGNKETAIISTNFNDFEVFIGIPVQSLRFLLNGIEESQLESCTIKVYDCLGAEFEDYYTAYEFLHGKLDAVLKAHSTLIWSIDVIVDDKNLHAKTLARSMERINQRIARNEAIEGHEVVVMLANMVKDINNTQEFANNLSYIYKRFLKPTDISLPALFNCIKEVYNSPELSRKLFAFCTLIKDQCPQLSDIQNISQDFNDSCGANIIFDEHQPDSASNRPPDHSASISSRTSDGIPPFEARNKGRKSSESQAESKADETKTIFDLVGDILDHNTLDSIAFITPELGRWSTVGGLGVMVDELSVGLAHLGEHVICISPYYEKNRKGESGYLAKDPDNIRHVFNVEVHIDGDDHILGVHHGVVKGVEVYFLHQPLLFPQPYVDGDATFTMKQMSLMAKASLQIFVKLKRAPSVIVTNDWFTGLVAAYPKQGHFGKFFNKTKFIHIAHNLDQSYEGRLYPSHDEGALEHIHGLPSHLLVNPQWNELIINPSRCAILSSDQWATVSNAYRKELLEFSPLAPILKNSPKSFAISNGILKTMRFQRILQVCDNDHLHAKEAIQKKYFKFPRLDNSIAIFGFVGRITQQKGVHLILEAIDQLIEMHNGMVQFIIGGMVHKKDPYGHYCADMIEKLSEKYPKNFWADPHEFFTDGTLLNAGCDFGLMPSLFEPGGIVQHEFFIGSTPVIAFQTGGLKDTVFEFNVETNKGNGFLFNTHNVPGFVAAVEKAYQIYTIPEKYEILRKNAFESTIDLDDVAKAWNKEFYNLNNKLFFEPKALLPFIDKIDNNFKASELEDKYTLERVAVHEVDKEEKGPSIKYQGRDLKYKHELKSTTFTYRNHGSGKPGSVLLVGTFNDWKEPIPLRYSREKDQWEVKMQMRAGEYYYKFVVDGNWVCVDDEERIRDLHYNLNNYKRVV